MRSQDNARKSSRTTGWTYDNPKLLCFWVLKAEASLENSFPPYITYIPTGIWRCTPKVDDHIGRNPWHQIPPGEPDAKPENSCRLSLLKNANLIWRRSMVPILGQKCQWWNQPAFQCEFSPPYIEGILSKRPYLPCVSMAGRALLAGYHRHHSDFSGAMSIRNWNFTRATGSHLEFLLKMVLKYKNNPKNESPLFK